MFAHQVIEDLNAFNIPKNEASERYLDHMNKCLETIPSAQKFFFENQYESARHYCIKLLEKSKDWIDNLLSDFHMPYKTMWVSWSENNGSERMVALMAESNNEITITIFNSYIKKPWTMLAAKSIINIEYTKIHTSPLTKTDVLTKREQEIYQKSIDHVSVDSAIAIAFIQILNCKNIGAETVPAPAKLNNKRKKKGKLPIFSYKTLVIKPFGKKQKALAEKGLWHNRIHLAMGHWRTYTKERPMFGKYYGNFWIHAHVRGQNRDGIVMKDYEVRP